MAAVGLLCVAVCNAGCASFRQPGDPWWGPDKKKHFVCAAAIAAGTAYAVGRSAESGETGFGAGLGAAAAAGAGKEIYDGRAKRTYFSGKDFVWDLVGGVVGGALGAAAAD